MSLATDKLESILRNVVHKQTGLHNDTFKLWFEEFFLDVETNANKSLDQRPSEGDSLVYKSMEDIFKIEIKDEKNDDAYLKCKFHFNNFVIKYRIAYSMHFEFIDDLQKLLLLLLPLIPNDKHLESSIDYLKKIKNGFEVYNSRYSQRNNNPLCNPLPEMQNMGLTLLDIFIDNAVILNIFDNLMSNVFTWDQEKMKIYISGILYEILKINNEVWLRTLFGPLKKPFEAMRIHNSFAERQLDKFFQLHTNQRFEIYSPDVGYVIWDTINYFNKMFEQIDINLLTFTQKQSYNAIKKFFNDIEKRPETEWERVFREKLNDYFPDRDNILI